MRRAAKTRISEDMLMEFLSGLMDCSVEYQGAKVTHLSHLEFDTDTRWLCFTHDSLLEVPEGEKFPVVRPTFTRPVQPKFDGLSKEDMETMRSMPTWALVIGEESREAVHEILEMLEKAYHALTPVPDKT